MKQYIRVAVFELFIVVCLVKSNPIKPKLCNLNSNVVDSFNVSLLNGKWYDLARSMFVYRDNTWTNGLALINVDTDQLTFDFTYSALDR